VASREHVQTTQEIAEAITDIRNGMLQTDGELPRVALQDVRAHFANSWRWSVHCLSEAAWFQASLFVVAACAAVLLLIGYQTRVATIVSWVMLSSLHARNPLILNGGDNLLLLMLFWSMFLPLGRVWSLDARRRSPVGVEKYKPVCSVATMAIMAQLCFMYFFSGIAKWNDEWLSGDALNYVFRCDNFSLPLARTLLAWPRLLQLLTIGTMVLETFGPFLLFLPWKTKWIRYFLLAAFVSLHIGIHLTMTVGMFSLISIAAWSVFVPSDVWNRLKVRGGRRVAARDTSDDESGTSLPAVSDVIDRRRFSLRFAANGFCAFLFICVVLWNISNLPDRSGPTYIQRLWGVLRNWVHPVSSSRASRRVSEITNLGQQWNMFDRPFHYDWWFVYRAELRNNKVFDLLRGGEVPKEQPPPPDSMYPNDRWCKLHRWFMTDGLKQQAYNLARYLARRWNEQHEYEEEIIVLEVLVIVESIELDQSQPQHREDWTLAVVKLGTPEETSDFKRAYLKALRGDQLLP
ncbi:MAG: HTTM domain-containing protein, partial [Planctomycetes bacterium]|nr:HTTM domain-containing protein [Planctomycetota bacterium]